ncbi:helix-turn-helix transcriptional regulator [Enterococcus sp.]|uniref:helix-turn-helix domain-containing protein n=1 Tax=Enterococcus sp. TaxID=35783 RepID=UPI000ED2FB58|nr:helix-turn-helix transcriptional regulator [Enterococcus sp.]HCM86228.1 hypothetical protein [Enterococcus sp.]
MKIALNEIISKRNISIAELQRLTNISRSTLTPLVNSTELPDKTKMETLIRLCQSLKIEMSELIMSDPISTKVDRPITLLNDPQNYDIKFCYVTVNTEFSCYEIPFLLNIIPSITKDDLKNTKENGLQINISPITKQIQSLLYGVNTYLDSITFDRENGASYLLDNYSISLLKELTQSLGTSFKSFFHGKYDYFEFIWDIYNPSNDAGMSVKYNLEKEMIEFEMSKSIRKNLLLLLLEK